MVDLQSFSDVHSGLVDSFCLGMSHRLFGLRKVFKLKVEMVLVIIMKGKNVVTN